MKKFTFAIQSQTQIPCMGDGCTEVASVPVLPLMLGAKGELFLSSKGLAAQLPTGWRIGLVRVVPGILLAPGQRPPEPPADVPAIFCPDHAEKRGE